MSAPRVLVTGSTDGIGLATAKELARRGADVIVHGRSTEKTEQARRIIMASVPGVSPDAVSGDFASLRRVRALAKDILSRFDRLDVLINNAGIVMNQRRLSVDGYELTFAVNHLAPFLLTNLLLDRIKGSAPARIINVSSMVHSSGVINLDDLQMEKSYSGWKAYCASKLANMLFSNALARRLDGRGVTVNSLHPGVIATKVLHKNYSGGAPVEHGARTPVYLALAPDVAAITGQYFADRGPVAASGVSQDTDLQELLWEASAALAGM